MGGYEISLVLIGALCGNLGAVILPAVNLGLFWNTALGGGGALLLHLGLHRIIPDVTFHWWAEFLAAGLGAAALVVLCGGVVALAYRE